VAKEKCRHKFLMRVRNGTARIACKHCGDEREILITERLEKLIKGGKTNEYEQGNFNGTSGQGPRA
jgi:hypothetical protein